MSKEDLEYVKIDSLFEGFIYRIVYSIIFLMIFVEYNKVMLIIYYLFKRNRKGRIIKFRY